nr:MAG TPA: hypothetical protein [Caudoviricetes sp.]
MNWEQFVEWIKTRDFCKGNYQYPAYVYSYPDFVALGDYCFFRAGGDITRKGRTILTGQTPDQMQHFIVKNFEV